MSKEKIKAAWEQAKKNTDKAWYSLTAKSKKIVLALSFLILVVVDKIVLNCAIFPEGKLLESNVFRALVVTLLAITVKDFQTILATKLGFKTDTEVKTDVPPPIDE